MNLREAIEYMNNNLGSVIEGCDGRKYALVDICDIECCDNQELMDGNDCVTGRVLVTRRLSSEFVPAHKAWAKLANTESFTALSQNCGMPIGEIRDELCNESSSCEETDIGQVICSAVRELTELARRL